MQKHVKLRQDRWSGGVNKMKQKQYPKYFISCKPFAFQERYHWFNVFLHIKKPSLSMTPYLLNTPKAV